MAKIYIFLADGFEEIEGLTVVDICRRARLDISTVSITDTNKVVSSHKIELRTDTLLNNINIDEADMLVLPGGLAGTNALMECSKLTDALVRFNDNKKMVAAICAAPSVLGVNGILKGKKATCYPGFEDKLLDATYEDVKVVKSENVITSCGMGASVDFGLAIVEHFCGNEKAQEIAKQIKFI